TSRTAAQACPLPAVGPARDAGGGVGDVLAGVRAARHGRLRLDRALEEQDYAVSLATHGGDVWQAGVARHHLAGWHVRQRREGGGSAQNSLGGRGLAVDLVRVALLAAPATALLGQDRLAQGLGLGEAVRVGLVEGHAGAGLAVLVVAAIETCACRRHRTRL